MANIKISEINEARSLNDRFYFLGVDMSQSTYTNYKTSYKEIKSDISNTTYISAKAYTDEEITDLNDDLTGLINSTSSFLKSEIYNKIYPHIDYCSAAISSISASFKSISAEMSSAISLSVASISSRIEDDYTELKTISAKLNEESINRAIVLSDMIPTINNPGMIRQAANAIILSDDNYVSCGVQISTYTITDGKNNKNIAVAYVVVPLSTTGGSSEDFPVNRFNITERNALSGLSAYEWFTSQASQKIATTDNYGFVKLGYATSKENRKFALSVDTNGKAFVHVPVGDTAIDRSTIKKNDNDLLYVDTSELEKASADKCGIIQLGFTQTDKKYPLLAENNKAYVELPVISADEVTISVDTDGKVAVKEISAEKILDFDDKLKDFLLESVYPISSVYMTKDENFDAAAIGEKFGGKWSYLEDLTANDVSAYVREE